MTEPDELITLTCDLCTVSVEGRPAGQGSAAMKLGLHKRRAHGVAGAKRRKKGAPSDELLAGDQGRARQVIAAAQEVLGPVGGTGVPDAAELAGAGGRALSIIALFGASIAVDSDQRVQSDKDANELIEALSLPEETATAMFRPIGRMLHPTRLNQKFGRGAVDNVDVVASFLEFGLWSMRWKQYLTERRRGNAMIAQAQAGAAGLSALPSAVAPAPMQSQTGASPPAPPEQTTPAPTKGVVVTPEMIAAARKDPT